MKFSVCMIQPPGYAHSGAFLELAELVANGLADLGHDAQMTINRIVPGTRHILIGAHLMDPALVGQAPADTIVLNTEQISASLGGWETALMAWIKHFETWDYSLRNIEALTGHTAHPLRHLRIGYHPSLTRIESAEDQDIDVLFYGSPSPRRVELIDRLKGAGIDVTTIFGVYGAERDKLIARSKIVLNSHYDDTQIFEVVRVFYLMANRKAVVSEVNPATAIDADYHDGIAAVPFEEIPAACLRILADDKERRDLEERSFATISQLRQADLLAPLI